MAVVSVIPASHRYRVNRPRPVTGSTGHPDEATPAFKQTRPPVCTE